VRPEGAPERSTNAIFGNDSRAPSGRRDSTASISQGIAPERSALGFILAARWAAFEPTIGDQNLPVPDFFHKKSGAISLEVF
jgi:hypothetical protein